MSERPEPYIGSVRFFKNLILLFVIIAILIPVGVSVYRGSQLKAARSDVEALEVKVAELSAKTEVEMTPPPSSDDSENEESLLSEQLAYQELYPDFYAPEMPAPTEYSDKTVYLTFDDGPSQYTTEILWVLKQQDIKATFFVAGHDDEESRQLMRDIVEAGHTLAMHTYSHDYSYIYDSVESFLDDMYRIFTLIKEATGVTPTIFRFPGGSINGYNFGISQELLAEMLRRGFIPYDWNLSAEDALDGRTIPAEDVLDNVLGSAARVNRGFVLLHDSPAAPTTAKALSPMIDQLREMGFSFAPITERVKPVLFNYQ